MLKEHEKVPNEYRDYVLNMCDPCMKYGNTYEQSVARTVKQVQKDWVTVKQWNILATGASKKPMKASHGTTSNYRNLNCWGDPDVYGY